MTISEYVLERMVVRLERVVAGPRKQLAFGVSSALAECVTERKWLGRGQLAAGNEQYVRHILYADAGGRFTVVAIVWRSGQRSSVHAHYTWSGAAVYYGELTETIYRVSRGTAPPFPVSNIRRRAGDFTFHWPLNEIHHVGNEGTETAVSIHVYGVGCEWLATGVNRFISAAGAATRGVAAGSLEGTAAARPAGAHQAGPK